MRYLAIGDIHGCFSALTALAAFVPLRSDDFLILLGDYVDRGPNSYAVLDWLLYRARRSPLAALRGNHELMMLRGRESQEALDIWLGYGGDATLASYSPFGDPGRLIDVPDEHWHFLEHETVAWYEIKTHFFVHANAYPHCALADQPDAMLYWETFVDPAPHQSGKVMVCGHTPQKSGQPQNRGHAVCIDTWVYGKGWLTCLNVQTGQYWQANERGQTRGGQLNPV